MVQQLVARLKDPTKEVRDAARTELYTLARTGTLGIDDAAFLIEAATGTFPKRELEGQDDTATMVRIAHETARDKNPAVLLPLITKHFAVLTPQAKCAALQIVTLVHTVPAATLYLKLLAEHRPVFETMPLPMFEVAAGPEVASTLFPAIMAHMNFPNIAWSIFKMLLACRQAGQLGPAAVKPYHANITELLSTELRRARRLQRPTGLGWRDETEYSSHRSTIGLLFDLAGYLDSKSLLAAVASCGDLLDPSLRRFRAITLLRRGVAVPDQELDWIAKSPRDRYWLFDQLHGLGLPARLPAACRDQALLAEGAMVDWLCYPTELGREPDEIILFAKESRSHSTGPRLVSWLKKRQMVDYYFFRFRVTEEHWSNKDGWMVGMAGGYQRKDQPTTSHDGGTFSTFAAWGSKTPAEHVEDYLSDEE